MNRKMTVFILFSLLSTIPVGVGVPESASWGNDPRDNIDVTTRGLQETQAQDLADTECDCEPDQSHTESTLLRANLIARQGPALTQTAAHHIVPGALDYGTGYGDRAREILRQFNIDINSADNGVFLPCKESSPAPGSLHPKIHTKVYLENLMHDLEAAAATGSRQEVLATLQNIANKLLQSTYPY